MKWEKHACVEEALPYFFFSLFCVGAWGKAKIPKLYSLQFFGAVFVWFNLCSSDLWNYIIIVFVLGLVWGVRACCRCFMVGSKCRLLVFEIHSWSSWYRPCMCVLLPIYDAASTFLWSCAITGMFSRCRVLWFMGLFCFFPLAYPFQINAWESKSECGWHTYTHICFVSCIVNT